MNHSESQLEKVKSNIQAALGLLPDQFALQEVKLNLQKTLKSINEVEKKRTVRKQREIDNQKSNLYGFLNMEDAKRALDILDKMMKDEENKIQTNKKPEDNQSSSGLFLG